MNVVGDQGSDGAQQAVMVMVMAMVIRGAMGPSRLAGHNAVIAGVINL